MNDNNKPITPLIDYLFWSLLILFTNPGGIVDAFNAHYIIGKIQINDLLFILLSICYIIIPKNFNNLDADFNKIKLYLIIFLTYYFVFHTLIVPILNGNKYYSFLIALTKSRHYLYHIFIFIYIYEFFKRRMDIFLKIFSYTSVFILILFLLQVMYQINIIPIYKLNRSFIDIDRNLMVSDGLLRLLVPMGIVILIFKLNIKFKYIILFGFALLPIYYIVSLLRREIISIFIYFLLAIFIYNYLSNQFNSIFTKTLKVILILSILIAGSYFIFPKYVEAARISLVESYNIIVYSKTSTGEKDERLGLNRSFILEQFLKYPIWGTGFDTRWRGGTGEKQGYEPADYPMLAAFAKYGISGVIIFIPIYFVIIRILIKDMKALRNKKIEHTPLIFLLLLTFILFFVFHLMQYFNWFYTISTNQFYYWYFFLALYLATRNRFYYIENQN